MVWYDVVYDVWYCMDDVCVWYHVWYHVWYCMVLYGMMYGIMYGTVYSIHDMWYMIPYS